MDTPTIFAIALKTTLLLACAGGVALLLAKKSAASRHVLWTAALALSLLMPIAVLSLPTLDIVPPSWRLSELLGSVAPAPAAHAWRETGAGQGAATIARKIWSAGALFLLLRGLVSHMGLILWGHRTRPLKSRRWAATIDQVLAEIPFDKPLRVLESSRAATPCTWGFIRPVLLVPESGDAWTESARRLALMHEIAHIRRHDYLTACLARLVCAIHWYNPLVWIAARQVRKLQEQACDDEVLRSVSRPSEYAQFLVDAAAAAAHSPPRLAHAALGVIRHSELRERVASILDPDRKRHTLPKPIAAALIAMTCLAFFVAAAAPQEIEPARIPRGSKPPLPELPAPPEPPPALPPVPLVPPVPPIAPVPPVPPDEPVPPAEARPDEPLQPTAS